MIKNCSKLIFTGLLTLSCTTNAADWNYDKLGKDWSGTCKNGKLQSPIDIQAAKVVKSARKATASYHPNMMEAVNNGHTVQFNPQSHGIDLVDRASGKKETFTLVQMHIHNGSEHTLDGKRYDLEAHFVHANTAFLAGEPDGRLAVVGVFLQGGKDNQSKAWNKLLQKLPGKKGEHDFRPADMTSLLTSSNNHDIYTYNGSLTTPGCSEVVNWMVITQPVAISTAAVASFAKSQQDHKTYRLPQPLNGRTVELGKFDWAY